AWLCLDFDAWPEGQVVHRDMFRLFVVPIENLFTEPAKPIRCDGTQARYPILPWRIEDDVAFHSVVEVQQELATGVDLILPSYLADGEESWDLELPDADTAPQLRL